MILASAGCANLGAASSCPDITGSYANKADGAAEPLSALLLPGRPGAESVRSVSIVEDESREQLIATAGSQHATLRRGTDYICDAQGLRLVKPLQSGIDLGEMLVHQVNTFHTFSKAPDGDLLASVSTKEHATVGGVPLAGPERSAGTVRWPSVGARDHRRAAPGPDNLVKDHH
ncbi:MAG: hypothetical protein ACJ8G7_19715 [Rhizobacter sp.]